MSCVRLGKSRTIFGDTDVIVEVYNEKCVQTTAALSTRQTFVSRRLDESRCVHVHKLSVYGTTFEFFFTKLGINRGRWKKLFEALWKLDTIFKRQLTTLIKITTAAFAVQWFSKKHFYLVSRAHVFSSTTSHQFQKEPNINHRLITILKFIRHDGTLITYIGQRKTTILLVC